VKERDEVKKRRDRAKRDDRMNHGSVERRIFAYAFSNLRNVERCAVRRLRTPTKSVLHRHYKQRTNYTDCFIAEAIKQSKSSLPIGVGPRTT
jgi:hypothetical protein